MKVVVTILQARRAVLPYIFLKHVLPRMRRMIDGQVEVAIIQHRKIPRNADTFLATNKTAGGTQRVADWTRSGRFEAATIIGHDIEHPPYPSIPSFHLACEAALERRADYHLWLEDDALVWDEECDRWPEIFGPREIGVYRSFSAINASYFVSRPDFDQRILSGLADYGHWSRKRRLEPWLWQNLRTRRVRLSPRYAVRTHFREYPFTGDRFVVDMVRRLCPQDLQLLDLELGPHAHQLAPASRGEIARLWLRDWARPVELARRIKCSTIEVARAALRSSN